MSKAHNGWLLILGLILQFSGWMAVYPADPSTATHVQSAALRGDETMAAIGILMGFGGMIATLIGLINVTRGMASAGGQGSAYAGVSATLLGLVAAAALISAGFELSVIEAPSDASAAAMMGNSLAIGSTMMIGLGIATLLLGIAIMLGKNLNVLGKNLYIVVGVITIVAAVGLAVMPFMERDSLVAPVVYLGWVIASLGLGIHSVKSAE
jgi:hypothetical protein